jgi:hypothetical protein
MTWIAIPRCPRCPMMLSISFAVVVPCSITSLMIAVHATNLLLGKESRRRCMSTSHPRTVLHSSNPTSALGLLRVSMFLCGMGLFRCFSQAHASIVRRVAHLHLIALLVPLMITAVWIGLSM